MAVTSSDADQQIVLPPDACDCHMHVFGHLARYPVPEVRSYTPQEAPLQDYTDLVTPLGLKRLVVVQPSVYGSDNSCIVDALLQLGHKARGVAQIDGDTTKEDILRLHGAGVRGVRLNPKSIGQNSADKFLRNLNNTIDQIASIGWHIQIYANLEMIAQLADVIRHSPVPIVLDHMGGARAQDSQESLHPLLQLLGEGRCWVKLSGAYRVSRLASGFEDATPVARQLIQTNPEHVIWGSDWPHTAHHPGVPRRNAPATKFRQLSIEDLLLQIRCAAGSDMAFKRILHENPEILYNFRAD